MEKYQFDDAAKKALEKLRAPLAVYQFLNKHVVTVLLSDGFMDLLGLDDREKAVYLMDHDMYEATHPDDKARISDEAIRFAIEDGEYDVVYRSRIGGSNEYRIIHAKGEHVYTEDGVRLAYVWYIDEGPWYIEKNDKRFSLGNALRRALMGKREDSAAKYDVLSGLPTMAYFFELVNQLRREHKAVDSKAVVLYMNLCGMKHYNRVYGFAVGDNLLRIFSRLIAKYFGQENCSRFSADQFCVFTQEENVEEILNSLFKEFRSDKTGPTLPVRVGIYSEIYGLLGISAECDRAKYACDTLRQTQISAFKYYNNNMLEEAQRNRFYLDNLQKALSKGHIQVYYQPLIRSANGRVCDEEALARWIDPERGIIPPDEFIPVLEEAKLVYMLDLYVVEQILKKIKVQKQEGLYVVPVSVNLSRSDFDACDIVEEIRRRVDEAGVCRSLLVIEVTETTVGKDFDFMKSQIERFRALGFPVWMDDFGSGYSALDMLHSIRFDTIKFDRRFMKKFGSENRSKIMLTELIRMALSLGMDTVCEGVETEEQTAFLREVGCTKIQGFYYSRPIPPEKILDRYRKGIQIGFENPDESDYYEAIGKINLYDLAVLSNDDEESFENYFNTIPMAIIEATSDHFALLRCNSSYRAFLTKMLGHTPLGKPVDFEKGDGITTRGFLNALRKCAEYGEKKLIEDKQQNGTVLHTFLKCIAVNPVSDTRAIVVAILTINDAAKNPVTFSYIAKALSSDYINLYYVNCKTDRFIEYSSDTELGELAAERHGDNFFEASHRDARVALYHEDLDMFLDTFTKEKILRSIDDKGVFLLSYRLMIDGAPSFVNLKAVRVMTDEDHIIFGLTKRNQSIETGAAR